MGSLRWLCTEKVAPSVTTRAKQTAQRQVVPSFHCREIALLLSYITDRSNCQCRLTSTAAMAAHCSRGAVGCDGSSSVCALALPMCFLFLAPIMGTRILHEANLKLLSLFLQQLGAAVSVVVTQIGAKLKRSKHCFFTLSDEYVWIMSLSTGQPAVEIVQMVNYETMLTSVFLLQDSGNCCYTPNDGNRDY